ncbi:MAG: macro domain-containing protein [Deltaproteobacteria bacterium]|nr:macro domain-containing protein [Deltaproteobacteria bacterium]
MIEITRGNVVEANAEALVNTVNCVGYMGKGIALQFKKAFPENFKAYERACRAKGVRPGKMFVFETSSMWNPKYIINFPTKRHWRGKSRLEDIEAGLQALVDEVVKREIKSIAIPPLGCGLGGLDWNTVRPMIEKAFSSLPDVRVLLLEPHGAPEAKAMPVRTKRPRLTPARALAYRLTLLEIQKLAYFLQEAGEPLRLKYQAHIYGPYAHDLNKVLEILEGHFIRGYGDTQKPDVEIKLLPGAAKQAIEFLERQEHRGSLDRLKKVSELIEGFETPYGMELLSSVHWIACHDSNPARTADDAVEKIFQWSERKRRLFRAEHIRIAWNRLEENDWLPGAEKD